MPRARRVDAPGAAHHVILRGIDGRPVFLDDEDRRDLAHRLSALLPDSGAWCLAWAFLTNHVHLVIRTGQVPLERLMRRLNTGYARRFNSRHQRRGYVFQDRYRSRMVHSDEDLRVVVRYVLLNPANAGLAGGLAELMHFPWCGVGALLGSRAPWPFESVRAALDLFGNSLPASRRSLAAWLSAEPPAGAPGVSGVGFLDPEQTPAPDPPPGPAPSCEGPSLEEIVAEVCTSMGLETGGVRSRLRAGGLSEARARIAWRAVACHGIPAARVAAELGLAQSSVTRAVRRGRELAAGPNPPPTTQERKK